MAGVPCRGELGADFTGFGDAAFRVEGEGLLDPSLPLFAHPSPAIPAWRGSRSAP